MKSVLISAFFGALFAISSAQVLTAGMAIIPVLECVQQNNDGTLTAYFGYFNPLSQAVFIPIGVNNSLTPPIATPIDTFLPGRNTRLFQGAFPVNTVANWTIVSPNGEVRTALASSTSRNCSLSQVAPPGELLTMLDCVIHNSDNTLTIWFGFINTGFEYINITQGTENQVSVSGAVTDAPFLGDSFLPGRVEKSWNMTVPEGQTVTWTVVNSGSGLSSTVSASSSSPVCQGDIC